MHELWSMRHVLQVLSLLLVASGLLTPSHTQAFSEYEFELPLYRQSVPWLTCPDGWTQVGINCLRVFPDRASYDEAHIVCKSYGGWLIDIAGLNYNTVVGEEAEAVSLTDAVWIGFKRLKSGAYQWANGKAGTLYDGIWLLGQPQVYKHDLDLCVSLVTSGDEKFRWRLEYCDAQLSFVCASASCARGDFRCGDGGCVTSSWRCDGEVDCHDGSDETGCGRQVSCGGSLTPPDYTFQTPAGGTGNSYPPWLTCSWKIQAPIGQKVLLQFLVFNTEEYHDVVTVRDGPLVSDRVIATVSGAAIPANVTSSTNYMLVTFTSDHSIEGKGFSAKWHTVVSLTVRQLVAGNKVEWITSPDQPDCVQPNSQCSWHIASNDLISIQILKLQLAEDDWLEVRDGETGEATLLAQLTGKGDNRVIISSGSHLHLQLKTGLGQTGRVFNITYHSGCDVTMSLGYGRITSPGYSAAGSQQYPNNVQCTWSLQDPQQRRLTLVFHTFDTEAVADSVLVYNSTTVSPSSLVVNVSGQQGPQSPLHSSSGQLVIHFRSDQNLAKTGWSASFSYGCHDSTSPSANTIRSLPGAFYTSSISYHCDTGYRLDGANKRYCDISGVWRTPPPTCKLIHCGPPPKLDDGALVNVTSRDYNGVAAYTCNPGHDMVGEPRVTCLEDGWSDLPQCAALTCPKLKSVIKGRISTPWKYYIYSRAEFRCNEGYRLVGYMFSECRNGSHWTHPEPTCVPVAETKCPEVLVTHGSVDKWGPIRVWHTVHVTCRSGYQLSADDGALNCTEDGSYDKPVPSCEDVDDCAKDVNPCGTLHTCVNTVGSYWCRCAAGHHHSGSSEQFCEDINECSPNNGGCEEACENSPGSFVCTCQAGHRLYNGSQVHVIGDKVLVPGKSCYMMCPALHIENVQSLVYSTEPAPDGSYISETRAWIQCPYGSVMDGPSIVRCEITGSWSAQVTQCTAGLCDELPALDNGALSYTGARKAGTFAEFSCEEGYRLRGNQHRFCQYVPSRGAQSHQYVWTGSQPVCEAVDCGPVPRISHGQVTITSMSYGSEAVYSCSTGYTMLGNGRRTCLASGRWSEDVIVCIEEACPNPDVPMYGSVMSQKNGAFFLGSSVSFSCDRPGYKLTDSDPLECVEADWTEEVVTSHSTVYRISAAVTVTSPDPNLQTCSQHYSAQVQAVMRNFAATVKPVCEFGDFLDITVKDDGVTSGSSQNVIHINKTISIAPVDGDLAIPVSRQCALNIWGEMNTEGSDGGNMNLLADDDQCPQLTVRASDIHVQEPVEACETGSLVHGETVNTCHNIVKGPVHMIHLDFGMEVGSSVGQEYLENVRAVIHRGVQGLRDGLQLPALCPQIPGAQLVNTSGFIVIDQTLISVDIPFFLYDFTSAAPDLATCARAIQENFTATFVAVIVAAIEEASSDSQALRLDEDSVSFWDTSGQCPDNYVFHDKSGRCVFCPTCETTTTTSTTPSTTTSTTTATTTPTTTTTSTTTQSTTTTTPTTTTATTTTTTPTTTPTSTTTTTTPTTTTTTPTTTTPTTTTPTTTPTTPTTTTTKTTTTTPTTTTIPTTTPTTTTITTTLEPTTTTQAETTSTTLPTIEPTTTTTTTTTTSPLTTTAAPTCDSQSSSDVITPGGFDYSLKRLKLPLNASFPTSTTSSVCVELYQQELESLLRVRQPEFIMLAQVYDLCTVKGAYVQFMSVLVTPDVSTGEVFMTVTIYVYAMQGFPGTADVVVDCASALLSSYTDMSNAYCLFRVGMVDVGQGCEPLHTNGVEMSIVGLLFECADGWHPQDPIDPNNSSCLPDTTTTTSTTTTTQPSGPLTCFVCEKGADNDACTATFESCTMPDPVCQTEVRYAGRNLRYISKSCEPRQDCLDREAGARSCDTTGNSPTCFYCCDEQLCNKDTTLLSWARKRRSVPGDEVASTSPKWNRDVPKCIDTEPPVFTDCPSEPIKISDSRLPFLVNVTIPSVTDNSGSQPVVTTDTQNISIATGQTSVGVLVFESVTLSLVATDDTGNHGYCLIPITILDTTPPQMSCPSGPVTVTVPTSDQHTRMDYSGLDLYHPADVAMVTHSPESGEIIPLLQEIQVTVTVLDEASNRAECQFTLIVQPSGCPVWSLRPPAYGDLSCKADKGVCETSCWKNSTAVVTPDEDQYQCTAAGQWLPSNTVPDCMPNEYMECPQWTYSVRWNLLPEAKVGVDNTQCNFTTSVAAMMRGRLTGVTNMTVFSSIDNGKIYITAVFTLASHAVQVKGATDCPGVLSLADLDNLTVINNCNESAQLLNATLADTIHKTCPAGQVLIENDKDSGVCWPCPVGYEARTAVCQPCQSGSYRDNVASPACTPCPVGTSSLAGATECRDLCREGEFSSSGVAPCTKCPLAEYQPAVGATSCLSCGQGTNTTGTGTGRVEECLLVCEPGEYSPTGLFPCMPCPMDTYSESPGATTCVQCPAGTLTDGQGAVHPEDCLAPVDHCADVTCSAANSHCVNDRAGHSCVCDQGYSGRGCESRLDPCTSSPCTHGSCTPTPTSYTCNCESGFTGSSCERLLDPCLSSPCNYGYCVRNYDDNTHTCTCYEGYTENDCSVNIDDCVNHSCSNGGLCVDLIGAYECDCQDTGYHGTDCEIATDMCEHLNCLHGGSCTTTGDGVQCACPDGYRGNYCEVETDGCDSSPCNNEAQCTVEENGDVLCICKTGFTGPTCDIENTSCDVSPCEPNGDCLYLDNHYVCSCMEGYTGSQCEFLIEHCSSSPCHADNSLECVEKRPGFTCVCQPGWTGETCSEEEDQCEQEPCMNAGTCHHHDNHYSCTCTPGYAGDRCQVDLDDCESLPCVNGGVCQDGVNSFTCDCPAGFTGTMCDAEINLCESGPCENRGTCVDNIDGFVCLCGEEWTGETCNSRVNSCLSRPCMNNGTCNHHDLGYDCQCTKGYTGENCELEFSACDPNPCSNGGSCTVAPDNDAGYRCACRTGFHGSECETSDACNCLNGGTCLYSGTEMICQCPTRYKGPTCDKEKSSNFDLTLTVPGPQRCVVQSPETGVTEMSVCLWFRSRVPKVGAGAFLVVSYNSQLLVEIRVDIVTLMGSQILLGVPDHLWHQLCVTWVLASGDWAVHIDGQTHSRKAGAWDNTLPWLLIEVGLTDDEEFAEVDISGLNIYSYIIDTDIRDLDTCDLDGNPGDLATWVDFDVCGGVVGDIITPSACPTTQCASGFRGEDCSVQIDKQAPEVKFCPEFVQQTIYKEEFSSLVKWDTPKFTDDMAVVDVRQTHKSNQTFAFGEHWVVYTAFDAEQNHATCSFRVFVTPSTCKQPAPPQNGVATCGEHTSAGVNSGTICTITCVDPAAHQFADQVAGFYTCRQEGLWDPPLGKHLLYPPCAGFTLPSELFQVDVVLSGPTCSDATKATLSSLALAQLGETGVCSRLDCGRARVDVDCVLTNIVKRDTTQAVTYSVNYYIPFYNLSQEAISGMQHSFDGLLKADMGDFTGQELNVTVQKTCTSGQVLNSQDQCVNCGKGYYYIREHNKCELCPLGSYSDREKQTACTPCQQGQTTLTVGSYTRDKCFAMCTLGHYLFDGVCEPCESGTYQDTTGATSCKPCPFGQTTDDMAATASTDCYVACGEAGKELTANGECVPCPQGTYKAPGSEIVVCQACPYGYTTEATGATSEDLCTLVLCSPGYWRTEDNTCEPCLVGTYQSQEGQTTCNRCPTGMTTAANASAEDDPCVSGQVDECAVGTDTCHPSAVCVDTEASHECQCQTGFTMDSEGACIDNCAGICERGTCVEDESGVLTCRCEEGYEGLRCQNKTESGMSVAVLVGISVAVGFILLVIVLAIIFCIRRHLLGKDGKPLWQFPIHRTDLRSSFRAFAMAMNPRYDMSGERRSVIRQGRTRPRWAEQASETIGSQSGHSNTSYF